MMDLDYSEIEIVMTIGLNSYSMKQLSEHFQENNSTMTGIIDRLEKKAVVVRQSGLTDRRVVTVSLTPKWRRKYNSGLKSLERKSKLAYEKITEERFDLLMKILSETNDRLKQVFPYVK